MTIQEEQRIKARFFGQHIGCMAFCATCKMPPFRTPREVIGVSGTDVLLDGGVLYFSDCKLILRPLSDVTDEEVFEAFNEAGIYGIEVFRDSDKIGVIGRNGISAVIWIKTSPKPVGRFLEAWNNFPNKPQPEYFEYMLVDYLRSKHFCLPFCGLDPIAEGWAILDEKFSANAPQKEEEI